MKEENLKDLSDLEEEVSEPNNYSKEILTDYKEYLENKKPESTGDPGTWERLANLAIQYLPCSTNEIHLDPPLEPDLEDIRHAFESKVYTYTSRQIGLGPYEYDDTEEHLQVQINRLKFQVEELQEQNNRLNKFVEDLFFTQSEILGKLNNKNEIKEKDLSSNFGYLIKEVYPKISDNLNTNNLQVKNNICECGGEKTGVPHSKWCPKY